MTQENVLVVKNDYKLWDRYYVESGICMNEEFITQLFNQDYLFIPRDKAENNPEFKQIIPYIVISSINATNSLKNKNWDRTYYAYRRSSKSTEDRLKRKWTLGFGGHINDIDAGDSLISTFVNGFERELQEETGLTTSDFISVPRVVGIINNDTTDVGKVHLGVLIVIDLMMEKSLLANDPGKNEIEVDGHWIKLQKITDGSIETEDWTTIILPVLDNDIIISSPKLNNLEYI